MHDILHVIVNKYGWIHLSLGLLGNVAFLIGSILFLPAMEAFKLVGVWLFIAGAFLMLIGSTGRLLVDISGD
ncbi:YrhK family protein [Allohahella marinimesophila]